MARSEVVDLFEDWASSGKGERMAVSHAAVVDEILELQIAPLIADALKPMQLLDIGCGVGYVLDYVGQRGAVAFGIDPAPTMIAATAGRGVVGTSENLPCKDRSMDLIFSHESLYYWRDAGRGLQECLRVLRPGGRAVISIDFYEENPESHDWPRQLGFALNLKSTAAWATMFEDAGFVNVQTGFLPSKHGRTLSIVADVATDR